MFNFSSFERILIRIEFGFLKPADAEFQHPVVVSPFPPFSSSLPSPLFLSAHFHISFILTPVSLICLSRTFIGLGVTVWDPNPLHSFLYSIVASLAKDTLERHTHTHNVGILPEILVIN